MYYQNFSQKWENEKYGKLPEKNFMIPHFGQRKLLLAEVDFLNEFGHLSSLVVYAGAAPGYHIDFLAELFPKHEFHLYDPRRFHFFLSPNIKTFQKYFTDSVAEKYKKVLFISDIRTSGENHEEEVLFNLKQQEKWCEIIKPAAASLKFRLPFGSKKKIKYFSGQIRLQAWVGIDSNETRLFTKCGKKIYYDPVNYEEKFFYFNKNLRLGPYKHKYDIQGFDYCNDCNIELHIWEKLGKVEELVEKATKATKQDPFFPPHGLLKELPLKERQDMLKYDIKGFKMVYSKNETKKDKTNKKTWRNNN